MPMLQVSTYNKISEYDLTKWQASVLELLFILMPYSQVRLHSKSLL